MMYVIFYVEAYVAREQALRSKLSFLEPEIFKNGRWKGNEKMEVFRYIVEAKEPRKFDGDGFYYPEYDLRFAGEVPMGYDSRDALMKLSCLVSQFEEKHIPCKLQIETK